jgi:hypothetical protein
MEPIT